MNGGDYAGFGFGFVAVFFYRQTTDFLGDFEGIFGIFEGFRIGVLAIHKNGCFEIGKETKLAKTKIEIKIFGGG